ncbi:hypothetical protein CPT_Muldoon_065 [Serratia phage Muldoon]|uniref:Phage protein n=1 Tax=Serratia phage Muldoon TaxID=2601678 RepID=A0A5P8PH68_9CAUD|nr:hypothetical protein HYP94_gp064 [Serratia phage Muldoon]QFR56021.1 hypothetical protein CPT_Muldoon_065 [Serratia phage Muldoon]UNA02433.1 hypothetical protein [Serratia phage SP1]
MTQAIKNVLNSFAYGKVVELQAQDKVIEPHHLDAWVDEILPQIKSGGSNIGKNTTRELMVQYILSEFDVGAFGVGPMNPDKKEISDKAIRKYKKMRKQGFKDIKVA